MDEIINKVKESGLISIDLANYVPSVQTEEIDITNQLWQGLVLKEKDFRAWIKENDWTKYTGKAVNVTCSADAIIPTWAYMLIASKLTEHDVFHVVGNKTDLEKKMISDAIQQEDIEKYRDGRIIIKGCADISCPEFAMTELLKRLQPVARSIMYGEPCSTVPVFKRK